MRGFRSSARNIWRTIICSLPSVGMAETGSETGSAAASTNTSDEKKFNESTPEKNPSETPQQEGGTHQDENKIDESTPEKNPSETPQQEGGTHQNEKKFNEFTPKKNTSKTQEGGTHQGTSKDDSTKKKKWPWAWAWEKKDFSKMSLEEKRFYYKCGKNFVTLDEILPWPEYVESHMSDLVDFGILRKGDKFHDENNKINTKVSLWQGDITHLEIDAIVNAANTSLRGGGGVDGCIHRAAGGDLFDECITLGGCKTGKAKMTSGYKLPAKKVIHTVGPIGENRKKLQSCYKSCLELVLEHKLRTVAFCCISTGVYGYPNEEAATVAVETVMEWLEKNGDEVDRIIFCVFLEDDNYVYHQLMLKYFPCTVASDDDDQDDGSKDKASAKERSKTEHKKGDEKSVKKLDGRCDVLNKEGQNKEDVGSGDHAKVVDTAAETRIEEDVETLALDQPTKSDTAKEKAEMKDFETDVLDQPTKSDTTEDKTRNKDDFETDADTAKEKAEMEDVETDVGGGGLESGGVDSPEESKMHVDRRCDNKEDSVDKYAGKEEVDEATERSKEGEGVQVNSSKPDGEKVENDEAVHEMKKRKRDADEKMELDVEESGDGDIKMDTEEVPGDKAQDETRL